jgi:hypothetical protein
VARRLAALLMVFCLAGVPALAGAWASAAAKMSCARTGKGNCCCNKTSADGDSSIRAARCAEKCCQTPAGPQSASATVGGLHVVTGCRPSGCAAPTAGTSFAETSVPAERYQRPPPVFFA